MNTYGSPQFPLLLSMPGVFLSAGLSQRDYKSDFVLCGLIGMQLSVHIYIFRKKIWMKTIEIFFRNDLWNGLMRNGLAKYCWPWISWQNSSLSAFIYCFFFIICNYWWMKKNAGIVKKFNLKRDQTFYFCFFFLQWVLFKKRKVKFCNWNDEYSKWKKLWRIIEDFALTTCNMICKHIKNSWDVH